MITPDLKQQQVNDYLRRFEEIVNNQIFTRSAFFAEVLERRAKVDHSCGYPPLGTNISIESYRELYDRFSIANRIVSLWPRECWQVQPRIVENEEHGKTEFEEAWEAICQSLQISEGDANYYQDQLGSAMWEYLARGDELSGIGTFGIILFGFADGKLLEQPVAGSMPDGNPYIVPNIVSSGMPDGARVIPGAFGGQAGIDYVPTEGPGRAQQTTKDIYGNPQSEITPETSLQDAYASVSRDIYGSATQNPLSSTLGTDANYRGIQFTPGFYPSGDPYGPLNPYAQPGNPRLMLSGGRGTNGKQPKQPKGPTNNLLFLRCFDESLVQVVQYEADLRNPRFGRPIMYLVTLNDPRYPHTGVGLPLATLRVHWSRVIHLADTLKSSEIFGMPRMQPVFNNLLDLRKLYGGSAEMYWQGALPGLSFETHPQLGSDVQIDVAGMREMVKKYMEGLERYLQLTGMTARTLAPTVVDPSNQIETQINAICIQLGIPKRVFMGSERGELASMQDDANWNDKVRHRQSIYLTPRVICPMVNRLIGLGVLPKPEGYSVKWPDLDSQTDATKATIAVQKVQAISAYTGGMPESILTPVDFYVRIMGHDEVTAKQIVEEAQLQQALAQMSTTPSGTMQQGQGQPAQMEQQGPGSSESELVTHSLVLNQVPAKMGTVPIPVNHVRLYHYTKGTAQQIREQGILLDKARGHTYGEPNVIWGSTKPPESHHTIVEFHVPVTALSNDAERPPALHNDLAKWQQGYHHVTLRRSISPLEIIAVHEPWHNRYRYIKSHPEVLQNVLSGKHDNLLEEPEYGPAIRQIKQEFTTNASTPNVRGGQKGSKEEPIGAYKEPNISEDSEGGKWLTVISSQNPGIIHHVPIGVALEKHPAASAALRGPQIGPMGQVVESLGKTKTGKSGRRARLGG